MSFRTNLQYLRAQRNMTQEQLAMLLGVSRQAISKWESEKAYPEMDKLLMICDLFGCTLDDLVLGDVSASVNVGAAARGAAEGDHGSAARTVTGEGAGEPAYMKDADGSIGESARSGGDGINGPSSANALPGEMLHGTSSSRPGTLANVAALPQDLTGYDEHRCRFALLIAGGVAAIIAGAGIGNLFDSDKFHSRRDATQRFSDIPVHLRGRDYRAGDADSGRHVTYRLQTAASLCRGFLCCEMSPSAQSCRGPANHSRVGSFCRSRKTSATTSRTAMESTPSEALPVRDVVVATRKVPMIEAVLPKIS